MVTKTSIPWHPWTRTWGVVTQTDENTHEVSRCTDERMDTPAHSYTYPGTSNTDLRLLKEKHEDPCTQRPREVHFQKQANIWR